MSTKQMKKDAKVSGILGILCILFLYIIFLWAVIKSEVAAGFFWMFLGLAIILIRYIILIGLLH